MLDTAKYPTQDSTHHPTNNYLAPNINNAGLRNPGVVKLEHSYIGVNIEIDITYSFVFYILSLFMIIKLIHL